MSCDARHKHRPDATCSRPKGHEDRGEPYHRWTPCKGCKHPRTHKSPPECTACGAIVPEVSP